MTAKTTPRNSDHGDNASAPRVQRALRQLYARRAAVDELIQAIENYRKTPIVTPLKRP